MSREAGSRSAGQFHLPLTAKQWPDHLGAQATIIANYGRITFIQNLVCQFVMS